MLIAALVRHADYHQLPDTPSAHQPFPLTEEGERQALDAARELRTMITGNNKELVPVIDSSRMLRAWQTADILASNLRTAAADLHVASFDELAERGLGCAANLAAGQIETVLREDPRVPSPPDNWKADSHYRLPLQGAESLLEAGERVAAHLSQSMAALEEGERDRLKIFVGHGAAFRHAAYHMGVLTFGQIRQLSMFHCRPVLIEYLPWGKWRHISGDWKVRDGHSDYTD
jgi:2,3-bisphosphoglycerate-dependent phosphoglycerate mutase